MMEERGRRGAPSLIPTALLGGSSFCLLHG